MAQQTQTKLARVRNLINRAGSWLETAATVVATIIAMALMITIILPVIFLIMLIPYNPVVYWVWAMIAPQSAAQSLYSDELHKMLKGETLSPVDTILNFPRMCFWHLNRALRFLLPWRSKKAFIAETEFNEGSFEEHLRFFHSEDQAEVINKGWLNCKERDHLWSSLGGSLRELMLPQMGRLSTEQFRILANCGEWQTIGEYMGRYTLSSAMLSILLNVACDDRSDEQKAIRLFSQYVKLHGLSAEVINSVYASQRMPENIRKQIENALEIFRQRKMLQAYAGSEQEPNWVRFCKIDGNLADENQPLMNEMQYLVYHTTTGKVLCASAVVSFLSQGDNRLAKLVLKHEVVENNVINDQIRSLIAANPVLAQEFLRLRAAA